MPEVILKHRGCGGIFRDSGRKAEYDVATLPIYVCDKCGQEHDSSDYEDTHFNEVEKLDGTIKGFDYAVDILEELVEHMDDKNLSSEETVARKRFIQICRDVSDEYRYEDE